MTETLPAYQPGALSALLSGEATTPSVGLFTTANKQKAATPTPTPTSKKSSQKRKGKGKAGRSTEAKKRKTNTEEGEDGDVIDEEDGHDDDDEEDESKYNGPSFKRQVAAEDAKERVVDKEKDDRTVFVGNIPFTAKDKAVKKKFGAYGKVETVRFRGVARPDMKTTKKVACIKRTSHDNRSNINAYVRFETAAEAAKACKANGDTFLENVIRVDMAGAPKKHDTSKAIFLGNLPLAIEENAVHEHFSECGSIADVRLVRDASSGIGKGFGYVNFNDMDSVTNAIALNGTKLEGRSVRVDRCVRKAKPVLHKTGGAKGVANGKKGRKEDAAPAPKKTTRKKLNDMKKKKDDFMGHAVGEENKKDRRKFKKNKGEMAKKKLSEKLLH